MDHLTTIRFAVAHATLSQELQNEFMQAVETCAAAEQELLADLFEGNRSLVDVLINNVHAKRTAIRQGDRAGPEKILKDEADLLQRYSAVQE